VEIAFYRNFFHPQTLKNFLSLAAADPLEGLRLAMLQVSTALSKRFLLRFQRLYFFPAANF
jgi:hypothetical protein